MSEETKDKEKILRKDKNCIHCRRFFNCHGKPAEVKLCLFFEERKKKDGE